MTETLKPRDAADALEAVRAALAARRTLELAGHGTRRAYGRPVRADAVLDLSALSGIVAYEPEELVLTLCPATPMAALRDLLAGRRQHLAFEPPDFGPLWGLPAGQGTLGGALGLGLGGPRRIQAGGPRDHFLGLKGVNGFGEAFAAGGRVVKNVTGYDLPKLLAGSLGTLAVLTEVTVKVLPAPPQTLTLVLPGLSDEAAVAAMTAGLNSPAEISGAAHLPAGIAAKSRIAAISGAGAAVTLLRLEGVGPSVEARAAALRGLLAEAAPEVGRLETEDSVSLWQEVADARYFVDEPERIVWRLSLPPSLGVGVARRIADGADCRVYYDWGGGALWLSAAPASDGHEAVIRGALRDVAGGDGHATLIRGPAALRERVPPLQPLAPGLDALTRRVKQQFDPQGLFNPGRMYEGL
ncbi:MAG TPA: FAD-binding protein [Alphaproteobacteria bacterium]|nr:FAD-binding protein [Alphaproteobacteria bacterium]